MEIHIILSEQVQETIYLPGFSEGLVKAVLDVKELAAAEWQHYECSSCFRLIKDLDQRSICKTCMEKKDED